MSRRFAVNSSPLILLGRISRLDLLPALAEHVVVPQAVLQELAVKEGQDWLARTVSSHPGIEIAADVPISSDVRISSMCERSSMEILHHFAERQ